MALIRDSRGYAQPDAPLTLKLFRPDEVEAGQPKPGKPALGGYHVQLPLALNARTGTWTVKAYADPKGEPVGQISFQVEDFVPQRLKLELSSAALALKPGEPATGGYQWPLSVRRTRCQSQGRGRVDFARRPESVSGVSRLSVWAGAG
jgi:uncharacterized protein YfaS (alpha-2-macroglobulin family)